MGKQYHHDSVRADVATETGGVPTITRAQYKLTLRSIEKLRAADCRRARGTRPIITESDIRVMRRLLNLALACARVFPSYADMAAAARCSIETVRVALKRLRRLGLIGWVQRARRRADGTIAQTSNLYQINPIRVRQPDTDFPSRTPNPLFARRDEGEVYDTIVHEMPLGLFESGGKILQAVLKASTFRDRIDLHVEVQAVSAADLILPPPAEGSREVAARVAAARAIQTARYAGEPVRTNAEADGALLDRVATPDEAGRALLAQAAETLRLTARGYHRVLRVSRSIADLAGAESVGRVHIAEALSYRRRPPTN